MCNVGTCSATTGGCETVPMRDGTVCDDGDATTARDRCVGGRCTGDMVTPGTSLTPGRTDIVVTRDGWSVRCLAWSGRTCVHGQARMECSVCTVYSRCGEWHNITTFNDGGQRCSKSFCGLATGSGRVNSTGSGGAAAAPRGCGWGSSSHPHCEAARASYHPPVPGVDTNYGLLLNEGYCSSGATLRTFDCAGW